MELRHLRYFVAVAEKENVSRAALKLHVSQPGISRQIHDLEQELGFSLFERSAKSLRLTGPGRVFLTEAKAVLTRLEEGITLARSSVDGSQGEIHVGYAPSLTIEILPRVLRRFQAHAPRVRVVLHDLSTEEMIVQLRDDTLQVALMVQPPPKMLRGLQSEAVAHYPICVAVTPQHRLAKLKVIDLAQIALEPVIAYSRKEYPEYHSLLREMYSAIGRKPRIVEEHDGVNSLIPAVESGRGFALLPSCVACMTGPRLKLIPLRDVTPISVIKAWTKERSTPAVVQHFLDLIPSSSSRV